MAILDIFSKRQKRLRGEVPDVYVYDQLPNELRVQIIHILTDALGDEQAYYNFPETVKEAYKYIVESLCREYGLFKLTDEKIYRDRKYLEELPNYILREQNIERVFDAIEIIFRIIDTYSRRYEYRRLQRYDEHADEALDELNCRFKEHGVGFQYLDGQIVRVDSELLHVEAVKPALILLHSKDYQGAQEEFLSAYEHYRHGKYKEALTDCLKSFESTMRSICEKRKWIVPAKATAKTLIDACIQNNLIAPFWDYQFTSLKGILESGIPTVRNKLSAHGQGVQITEVPDYLVSYMLHTTASTIVLLIKAEQDLQ